MASILLALIEQLKQAAVDVIALSQTKICLTPHNHFTVPPWHVHAGMHALARQIFNTYLNIVQSHTHSLTSRLHIGGQSVCFCSWLSHIAQRHCVIEEPLGFRVWVPLWSILTNRTVTAEAEVLLPVHQEYFCLKPESLKYWFVLLACFKAG